LCVGQQGPTWDDLSVGDLSPCDKEFVHEGDTACIGLGWVPAVYNVEAWSEVTSSSVRWVLVVSGLSFLGRVVIV